MKAFLLTALLASVSTWGATQAERENEYYRIVPLPIPQDTIFEVGAIHALPDARFAVCTRLGDVFIIENALQDPPANVRYKRYAHGLHEALGLAYRDGALYVTQRGEVTRLSDTNGDGEADLFETISDAWGMTGDYHEYAFGSKFDREGNIWVALCLTGSFTSEAPYRGWALRVTPEGEMIPTASGLRSPGGIGTNSLGDMFYTDNQGPWNGTSALKHLVPGGFMGNPLGNKWYKSPGAPQPTPEEPKSGSRMHVEAKRIPQLIPSAILFPYNKMGQSASGFAPDGSNGKFGAFTNQLFVGDQTHSTVMRVFLEKVNGRYQGALFPFKEGFGSGTLALEFASDGSLLVSGTDRGWGARGGKPFALERLVWTGQTPFEIHEMRAKPDGFELSFTEAVDAAAAANAASYKIETYTYIYQSSYGSPEVDRTTPKIAKATVSDDRRRVNLTIEGLQEGHVHELHLPGIRAQGGAPLLHPVAYYTLNYIPQ